MLIIRESPLSRTVKVGEDSESGVRFRSFSNYYFYQKWTIIQINDQFMFAKSGLQLFVEYIGYKFTSSPSTNQSKARAANLIKFSWIENFQQLENKSKIMQM